MIKLRVRGGIRVNVLVVTVPVFTNHWSMLRRKDTGQSTTDNVGTSLEVYCNCQDTCPRKKTIL